MPSINDLKLLQALPLDLKIAKTKARIKEWVDFYGIDGVYISFSGGKDSTVLLHIARQLYPSIEAVFVDTGLEYPEVRAFVKTFDNVTILRPAMRFDDIIKKYGYPLISKEVSECVSQGKKALKSNKYLYRLQKLLGTALDKQGRKSLFNKEKYAPLLYVDFNLSNLCCNVMKKKPVYDFFKLTNKHPITAQITEESLLRKQQWLKNGCNGFSMKKPISNPMSFWTEQDIYLYIKENHISIASVYGDVVYKGNDGLLYQDCLYGGGELCTTGCNRTGCIFCAFGAHLEKGESRFQRLKRTHPRLYEYCIGGGEYVNGIWQPNQKGLGMGHVFNELHIIYGKDFIKY